MSQLIVDPSKNSSGDPPARRAHAWTARRSSTRAGAVCAAALAIASVFAAGCGDENGGDATTTATSGSSQSVCATDPRAMTYNVGIEEASTDGSVKVRFVDANPAPPSKGNNTFKIELLDSGGAPIEGATIATKPFMPDHGHGSSVVPQTTPMDAKGQYSIAPVTLFMPGIWQITFTVDAPSASTESVVFTFCIDG